MLKEFGNPADMVEMSVGEEHRADNDIMLASERENLRGIAGRIDKKAVSRSVPDEIRIRPERPQGKSCVLHRKSLPFFSHSPRRLARGDCSAKATNEAASFRAEFSGR